MTHQCETEVRELHQFFQEWFRGDLPNTSESFARFADVLEEGFQMIVPGGVPCGRAALLERLQAAYGLDLQSKIWVEKIDARALGPDLFLVTYEEWQTRASGDKGRLSSALFRGQPSAPNGVVWLHLHETWLPAEDSP
ncbi:MAG: hypothetical protein ACI9F9_001792 [Candidatus Paceibacteria bacterium]|jgi:hypothetical protein